MLDNLVAFSILLFLGKWNIFDKDKSRNFYYHEEKKKYKQNVDEMKTWSTGHGLF